MTQNSREVLEVLKLELNFIQKGGYGRSVKTPWKPTSIFEDSPICLNYADPEKPSPCTHCLLIDFVLPEDRKKAVPCHHIPLNSAGETVDALDWQLDQHRMEEEVERWLCSTINQLEGDQREELTPSITYQKTHPEPSAIGELES